MAVESPIYDKEKESTEQGVAETKVGGGSSSNTAPTTEGSNKSNFYYSGSGGKALDSNQLSSAENGSGTKANEEASDNNFYHPGGEKTKVKLLDPKRLSKNKNKLFAAGGGAIAFLVALVIIFSLLNGLFLQSFAQTMIDEQFASVTRDFAQDSEQLTDEKAALDTQDSDDPTSPNIALEDDPAIVSDFSNDTGGLWTKIRGYTPKGMINNLKATGDIDYVYGKTPLLNRSVLQEIKVGSQTIDTTATNPSTFTQVLHPVQTLKSQIQGARDIHAGLLEAQGDEPGIIATLVRGSAESTLREEAGIPLYAWVLSKFPSGQNTNSKTTTQAEDELDEEAEQRINPSTDPVPEVVSEPLAKATEDGDQAAAQAATNDTDLEASRAAIPGTNTPLAIPPAVDAAVSSDLSSTVSSFLSKSSVVAAIAIPLCVIYDGSLSSPSAPTVINNNNKELERSFYFVQSASDQVKAGNANAEVVGALNTKLGNLAESNVEIRANGGTVDTLSGIMSPDASATGQFSVANTFLPSWAAIVTNKILATHIPGSSETGCQLLTDPSVLIGAAAAQIIVAIVTSIPDAGAAGGGEVEAETAVTVAVDEGVNQSITQVIQDKLAGNAVTSTLLKASGKIAQRFSLSELKKMGAISLATAGLAVVAKETTLDDMGQTYDGLSQGVDFANQADAGANLNANEVERTELYGAPLGLSDVEYNANANKTYLADQNKSESFGNRYLALSNPDSLVTRFGVSIDSSLHNHFLSSVASDIGTIFDPVKLFSGLLGRFDSKVSATAVTADNNDYGIVQWGYTKYEEGLINPTSGNPSYQPLENSRILFNSGEDQYIEDMYGPCYSDDLGTLLTQKPPATVDGYTTPDSTDPYILRDTNGNVIGGLCSQKYLGPNSADPNAFDTQSANNNAPNQDLIFRWRLNHGYNNTLDQLTGIQNAVTT